MTPVRPGEHLSRLSGEFRDAGLEHAFRSDRGVDDKRRDWSLFIAAGWLVCDAIPIMMINFNSLGVGAALYIYILSRILVVSCAITMLIAVWRRADYTRLDQIALPMLVSLQIAGSVVLLTSPTLGIEDRVGTLTVLTAGFFLAPFPFRRRLLVSAPFLVVILYRFSVEAIDGSPGATLLVYWAIASCVLAMIAARMFRAHRRTVFLYRQAERRHIEQMQVAYDEVTTANQMKTHFVASTAHDLRNPLNAVLGFSEIIEKQIFGPDRAEKYHEAAGDIHKCAQQMLHQIESLLDAAALEARPQTLHLQSVDLKSIATSVIRQVEASGPGRGLTLSTSIPDGFPPVFADRNALHQILVNLVSNAQKFTQNGGRISITAQRTDTETIIHVIDNGSGIPENQRGQMTDRFTMGRAGTLSREPGWGLGLSIVDALIRAHGGRLTLSTNNPRGTIASIHLPGHVHTAE